jgi:hypothetical protein
MRWSQAPSIPWRGAPRTLGDSARKDPPPTGAMNAHPHDDDGVAGTVYVLCRRRHNTY